MLGQLDYLKWSNISIGETSAVIQYNFLTEESHHMNFCMSDRKYSYYLPKKTFSTILQEI